jgi:HAD superfamily hydrolase (TIGR01484 family)
MTPLPAPSLPRIILSFDFDGTLYRAGGNPSVSPALFAKLEQLRGSHGALWGINTGRGMGHVVEGLVDGKFPFSPDWVVAREREIWFPNDRGRWLPHDEWNQRCEKIQTDFFEKCSHILGAIRQEVEEHTGATWIEQPGDPAGMVARTEEEMAWIVSRVVELSKDEPDLSWQRNSIWLRFGHKDFQKGSSLAAVARHFGLGPDKTFAIGDSHNDFEMLVPEAAEMAACPANAVPEIRAHVAAVKGYIARQTHSDGCVEALTHFFGA